MTFALFIDAFFNYYRKEIEDANISEDILDVFRLARKGWNMADIVRESYKRVAKQYKKEGMDAVNQAFCKKFLEAQKRNLNGDNLISFAKSLNVKIPSLINVKLGKYF